MKYNPVAYGKSIGSNHGQSATASQKIVEYYERIRDNCPHLEELDDDPIREDYYKQKINSAGSGDTFKNQNEGILKLEFF